MFIEFDCELTWKQMQVLLFLAQVVIIAYMIETDMMDIHVVKFVIHHLCAHAKCDLISFALKWKCLELIKQFSGVDMDVRNTRMNQTPAHIAAQERQAECVAWLVQQGITLGIQVGGSVSCIRK